MGSTVTDRITGLSTSVAIKAPVQAITQGNITLYGLDVQAGGGWAESLVAGNRVLVKDQSNAVENGIYIAHATGWRRARDFNGYRDAVQGTAIPLASTGDRYRVVTEDPIIIGSSEIEFQLHPNDARVIPVSSRAIMKTYDVPSGYQFSLEEGGRSGMFVVKSGVPPADPKEGVYIVLDNGSYAERIYENSVNPLWFHDGTSDHTDAIKEAVNYPAVEVTSELNANERIDVSDCYLSGGGKFIKAASSLLSIFNVGSNVTFENIEFESEGESVNQNGIIYISEAAKAPKFINCRFVDTSATYCAITASDPDGSVLYETNVDNLTIRGCHFSGFTRPLYLACIDWLSLTDSEIEDCRFDAIRTRRNMDYISIQNNKFRRIGVNPPPDTQSRDVLDTKWAGRRVIFSGNLIEEVAWSGIDIKGAAEGGANEDAGEESRSLEIIVSNNIFSGIQRECVKTGSSGDSLIVSGNVFESTGLADDDAGAVVISTSNASVVDNQFVNYGRGVFVDGNGSRGVVNVDGNFFINGRQVDIRVRYTDLCRIINNTFNGHNSGYASQTTDDCPAFIFDVPSPSLVNVAVEGNFFNKEIMFSGVADAVIRSWKGNLANPSTRISTADQRRFREAGVVHSDWGFAASVDEADPDNYNFGDLVVRYGASNDIMVVGAAAGGDNLGSGSTTRQSFTVTLEPGFDFSSLSVGDFIDISTIRGIYRVTSIDEPGLSLEIDIAAEASVGSGTITKKEKAFFTASTT